MENKDLLKSILKFQLIKLNELSKEIKSFEILEIVLCDFIYNKYGICNEDLKLLFNKKDFIEDIEILELIQKTEELVNKLQNI